MTSKILYTMTLTVKRRILISVFLLFLITIGTSGQSRLHLLTPPGDTLSLKEPFGLCATKDGTIYIADVGDHTIKQFKKHSISVFAGTTKAGHADGPRHDAQFDSPSGIFQSKNGSFYIAGFGEQRIRKISTDGQVSTIAGTGKEGYRDGLARKALFSSPRGICMDSKGNLFVCDCWNHRIRQITSDGIVSTFAGGGKRGELVKNGWKDGQDTAARFNAPCGISIDQYDNLYVADANNHCIRKFTPGGRVTTIAGQGAQKGFRDGPASQSLANVPTEVFCAPDGNVYFSDTYNNRIRIITPAGIVHTLAGNGKAGFTNQSPLQSELNKPRGITVVGNKLFFTEWSNHSLRYLKLHN